MLKAFQECNVEKYTVLPKQKISPWQFISVGNALGEILLSIFVPMFREGALLLASNFNCAASELARQTLHTI